MIKYKNEQIASCDKKCPKCKSQKILLIELWESHSITWELDNGKFDLADGALESGNPFKLEGRCLECSHHWTFRKATQINDIIK